MEHFSSKEKVVGSSPTGDTKKSNMNTTKSEVFKELLKEYEEAEEKLIYEYSWNISKAEKQLKKEIAEWAKRYEEAE